MHFPKLPDWLVYAAVVLALLIAAVGRQERADAPPPPPPVAGGEGLPLGPASPFDPQVVVDVPGKAEPGIGTAFSVSDSGVWVTARHVVDGCTQTAIVVAEGRGVEAQVHIDPRGEAAALVTLQADGLPALIVPEAAETAETETDAPVARQTVFTTGEGSRMDLDLLSAALKLSTQVPEGTPLAFSTANGLGWSDARGWKVFIGNDLTNLETKVSEYETIVQQLSERGITPVMISVEHTSAPFFRTE